MKRLTQCPPPGPGTQFPVGQLGPGHSLTFELEKENELINSTTANNESVFFTVQSPFQRRFHRDNVLFTAKVPDHQRNFTFPKTVTGMTLNSALADLRATTLKAISGTLRKLQYLAGLRDAAGTYTHWGLARVHGELAATKALAEEHRSLVS